MTHVPEGQRIVRTALALATIAAAVAAQEAPRQVFRSGIDLVTVDAIVLDRQGRPITDLKADDFLVVASGRSRKVVFAQFIPVVNSPVAAASRVEAGPVAESTSNAAPPEGRSFLIVVDVEQITSGGGMVAMRAIEAFVSRLAPDDRAGVVALPYGRPRVDLTTNRALVRGALGKIAGASRRRDEGMSIGEAVAIDGGDRKVFEDWAERTRCNGTVIGDPVVITSDCARTARDLAGMTVREERRRVGDLLDSLRVLAGAMATLRGLKTIVLVSEGMLRDRDTADALRRFAEAAASACVTLYSLALDTPQTEAADSMTRPPDRGLDAAVKTAGMADAAKASGGEMFLISGTPDRALEQIDAQLAGYYLLSFESDPGDAGDRRRSIQVRVSRPDATVRARSDFSIPGAPAVPAAAAAKDLRGRMTELIRWPVPVNELALDLATFAAPGAGDSPRRVVIAAELPRGPVPAAVGLEVVDTAGKPVADLFEREPKTTASASGLTYLAVVSLAPGQYHLKFGVLAIDGRRGSIEHGFGVQSASSAPVQLGDVLFGIRDGDRVRPIVRVPEGASRIAVQVEVGAAQPAAFDRVTVSLELLRRGEATPFATGVMRLEKTADRLRRVATATLALDRFTPGEYVVRTSLTGDSIAVQASRVIRKD